MINLFRDPTRALVPGAAMSVMSCTRSMQHQRVNLLAIARAARRICGALDPEVRRLIRRAKPIERGERGAGFGPPERGERSRLRAQ
jgi:hypothetical protein